MKSRFFDSLTTAVAGGMSIRAAAERAKCAESTAYNLSATVEFRQRVAELRAAATDAAVGQLSDASVQAVATLRELLDASNEPGIRLNAAKAILASLGPITELAELRERLQAVESNALRIAQ